MRIALLFFFLLSISAVSLADNSDYIIEPGVRVGPITALTTEEELVNIFGQSNVITSNLHAGEVVYKGTILFPDDPKKKLTISWKDSNPNRNPASISIEGDISRWATRDGVTLGTALEDIVRLNGGVIELNNEGDSWDFWGFYIHDIKGGVLKNLAGKGLFVKLGPKFSWPWEKKDRPDFWEERGKNGTILSDHPGFRKTHYHVEYMSVNFDSRN
ncbi:MAG: hypothetical protein WCH62_06195 [Candidatus Omnitrophota bacterium]